MTDSAHSPLGPSGAPRWIVCPGSVNATRGIADKSSEFAAEGNFAHDIAEMAREQDRPAADFVGHTAVVDGFEFTCDKAMAEYVQFFIDYVNQFEADENLNESRVSYDAWVDDGFGTLDAGLLNDGQWYVIDLKYGKGVQVYAEDNAQLKLYALGLYQEYGDMYECETIRLCIVQPRLNWIDEWEISIDQLLVWADEVVEPAADLAMTDTAPFKAGPHCTNYFCKIRNSCRTRKEHIAAALTDEIDEIRDPNEVTVEELGHLLDMVPEIRKWCNEIWAMGEKLVMAGEEVIGDDGEPYKMVAGRGSRSWRDPVEAEKSLRNYKVKVGEIFESKMRSPAAMEKIIGKKHPMLAKHVVTSQGKPALVPGSDKRPSYKVSADEMDEVED